MELTDGRVTLRSPTREDAPTIAGAIRTSIDTLHPWMPWASERYDESDAMQWIDNLLDGTAVPLLILDEDHQMVGATGYNRVDGLNHRANLGY